MNSSKKVITVYITEKQDRKIGISVLPVNATELQ